jgi:ribosome-binding protein aMBF1 (putative translation factor)
VSRRTSLAAIVKKAIEDNGASTESVAQAADLNVADLEQYLQGEVPFPVSVLVEVGGFLHVEAPHFLKGAA